jgi:hypothetical protein
VPDLAQRHKLVQRDALPEGSKGVDQQLVMLPPPLLLTLLSAPPLLLLMVVLACSCGMPANHPCTPALRQLAAEHHRWRWRYCSLTAS